MRIQDGSRCRFVGCIAVVALGVLAVSLATAGAPAEVESVTAVARLYDQAVAVSLRTRAARRQLERSGSGTATPARSSVRSPNFIVLAGADERLAEEVLKSAERLRRSLAINWFGHELPPGAQPAIIEVRLQSDRDEGLTWLAGTQTESRHRIWIHAPRDRVLGSTLAHELTHVLLHERFPDGMPAWANEGVASLADDPVRQAGYRHYVEQLAGGEQWPSLATLFERREIAPADEAAYALSTSLVRFLLSCSTPSTLFDFVAAGPVDGWDRALWTNYELRDRDELQERWRRWVLKELDR